MEVIVMKRILTGDRPTGKLHIGHYFGSLKNRVRMQDEYETFIMIADVQALTDNFNNPDKVRSNVYEVLLDNLAVGIDPRKTKIFIQSMIPEISELTVFYSNLVTIARLERNPTVKQEIKQKKDLFGESVTYGFLGYPVSQAADITILNADVVPCGDDQLPMLEQTREIVRKFNSIYGNTFNEPEPIISNFPRVKGLDGSSKMGKSLNNAIYLDDDSETIRQKVMGAITDEHKIKKDDKGNPNNCTVYFYHEMFSQNDTEDICNECKKGTRGCVDCKRQLADNIIKVLGPIREKRMELQNNKKLLDEILMDGYMAVKPIATEMMKKVRNMMKIDYFS
ncbi:MAG TPA: tryptophan--tRNA ligase [Clostridiales bacterium]|nr:tryptophan--tRNA ligase [Clostridiales bacterium]